MANTFPVGPFAYGLSFGMPAVLAKCHHNVQNALYKRHLSTPPNCITREFHPSFLAHIKTNLAPLYQYQYTEDTDRWKEKKTASKLAAVDESKMYDRCQFQKAKSFVKREVTVGVPSKARLIQGNVNDATAYFEPDAYKAISNLMQHIVYSVDGIEFDLHYTSHLNIQQISRIFSDEVARPGYHCFDERDGKNWDSTMQEAHMRYEASIYALFDERVASNHILRSTSVAGTVKSSQSIIKYTSAWKRLSGDWNTSVGNTIISMAIIISVILSLPSHLRPKRVFGLFLGDDYLGIYTFAAPPKIHDLNQAMMDGEKSYGITPVRSVFLDPLLCEYISLSCWPTYDGGYAFVPKISNMLVKLFYSIHPPSKHLAYDITATVKALRPAFTGLSLMQRFFSAHIKAWPTIRKAPQVVRSALKDPYYLERATPVDLHVNWAYGFAHKFRLPITALDFDIEPITHAQLLRHPTIDQIFTLEHLDPDVRALAGPRPL